MAKSKISKGFAKFANKATSGSFDEARKAERTARGIPFPVGTKGTGIVTVIADEMEIQGESTPYVVGEITVLTPEGAKGRKVRTTQWVIRDSQRPDSTWTAEDAWTAALSMLEQFGCPTELTQGYEDFQEVVDWFDEGERLVDFEVRANNYTDRSGKLVEGKQIEAFAHIEDSSVDSAEDSKSVDIPNDAPRCTYRGVEHAIVHEQDDQITVVNVQTGRERTIDRDDVTMKD